jgi:hypothetical protein
MTNKKTVIPARIRPYVIPAQLNIRHPRVC